MKTETTIKIVAVVIAALVIGNGYFLTDMLVEKYKGKVIDETVNTILQIVHDQGSVNLKGIITVITQDDNGNDIQTKQSAQATLIPYQAPVQNEEGATEEYEEGN